MTDCSVATLTVASTRALISSGVIVAFSEGAGGKEKFVDVDDGDGDGVRLLEMRRILSAGSSSRVESEDDAEGDEMLCVLKSFSGSSRGCLLGCLDERVSGPFDAEGSSDASGCSARSAALVQRWKKYIFAVRPR